MSADGKYVVVGLKSDNILSLDTSTKFIMWDLTFQSDIGSVDISSDGGYVVASDRSGNLYLFSNTSLNLIVSITAIAGIVIILITTVIVIWLKKKRRYDNINLD